MLEYFSYICTPFRYKLYILHAYKDMKTHQLPNGLTDRQVLESRQKYGINILTPPKKLPWWVLFQEKFSDPLIKILMMAGVLSVGISIYEYFGLKEGGQVFFEPVGIFIAILLATGLAFYFENKANREFAFLNQVNDEEPVHVIRNGQVREIPRKDVVVGDIVMLSTGDEVPADGELINAVNLHVDESTLTGEPVCTKTADSRNMDTEATYPSNCVLRGTKVMEGHGYFEVKAVGDRTENGQVYHEAQIDDSVKTPLDEQLDRLSKRITYLSYICAGMVIIGKLLVFLEWHPLTYTLIIPTAIFFYLVIKRFQNYSKAVCASIILTFFVLLVIMVIGIFEWVHPGEDITLLMAYTLQTLMIAVTLTVVAIPEGLPMAVTLSLAYSMRRMLQTNNLVRKMHACETMGATTVICTDKTGTLTRNQMSVYELKQYADDDAAEQRMCKGMAVNSTASLDLTDPDNPKVLGNPTEGALLLWLQSRGENYRSLKETVQIMEELPFSTDRKYMATQVRSANGKTILYVKGAPEIVLSMCQHIEGDVGKDTIYRQLHAYQMQAMRTLGFAWQELSDGEKAIAEGRVVAERLTFSGIAAISDPVRDDVPAAVVECMGAGIGIKIVTGDTPGTAKEIGKQIGLWKDTDTDANLLTGVEVAAMSDNELDKRVNDLKIIARARPMDKKRLVESLRRNQHVVSVTGDGTNDAPALHAAHVGLSMGDGTSVAKEASDITIIDNSFSSIGRAVMWGRSLYKNIQRFLLFQLTVNVAACFIVLFGAFMGTESPLTVTQMLWVNLIMDTFGAMALASLPPSPLVMDEKPRDRNAFIITRRMNTDVWGVGLFFFALTLAFLYVFQHADITQMTDLLSVRPGQPDHITPYEQTLLFSIFVWTHFWYMFNTRSFGSNKSFFELKQGGGFKIIVAVIVIGQVVIVELLYNFFNVRPMFHTSDFQLNYTGMLDWVLIVGLSSLVLWVREGWQWVRVRR